MPELRKEEKKVEYLELIYDLIFVYIIGRNNTLLHEVENGFISGSVFFAYVLCTLTVIQIWNFSTFYVNRYGRNGPREHVFIFVNMFLLYYMAEGTSAYWHAHFYRYTIAWALILVNIGIQYFIELRTHCAAPWEAAQIKRTGGIILIEAALVAVHILVYSFTGVSIAWVPILFGIAATALSGRVDSLVTVDFTHLTERAMLYVVFTFGEMIIAAASYFKGDFSVSSGYFSLMAFLIVAGLFLSYELVYNYIIDREKSTNGTGYMLLHVFLIFALNNITTALEFMREEEVSLLPKTLFLTFSILLYYVFLFLTERYAKKPLRFTPRFRIMLGAIGVSFAVLMLLFREHMYLNIAVTVIYVFGISLVMHVYGRRLRAEG